MSFAVRPSQLGFLAAAALAFGLSLTPAFGTIDKLRWLFGPLPPPLAIGLLTGLGFWALSRLRTNGRGLSWRAVAMLGAVFVLPPVAIDLALPLPRDLNVLWPGALVFYPVAGFAAEVVFHLLPLAIMAVLLRQKSLPVWAFAPAVLAEPLFQALVAGGLTMQGILAAVHVAAFSAVQIWVFQRRGFLAMYALRMVFYLFWHILWGSLRLTLLF